jgi:small nuclear ribonucleoprotein (snRNP)-like protein
MLIVANDNDNATIRLLRERNEKLEATLSAYDRMMNTPLADALRKRNAELERALYDVAHSRYLPQALQDHLKVTLGNKVTPKY